MSRLNYFAVKLALCIVALGVILAIHASQSRGVDIVATGFESIGFSVPSTVGIDLNKIVGKMQATAEFTQCSVARDGTLSFAVRTPGSEEQNSPRIESVCGKNAFGAYGRYAYSCRKGKPKQFFVQDSPRSVCVNGVMVNPSRGQNALLNDLRKIYANQDWIDVAIDVEEFEQRLPRQRKFALKIVDALEDLVVEKDDYNIPDLPEEDDIIPDEDDIPGFSKCQCSVRYDMRFVGYIKFPTHVTLFYDYIYEREKFEGGDSTLRFYFPNLGYTVLTPFELEEKFEIYVDAIPFGPSYFADSYSLVGFCRKPPERRPSGEGASALGYRMITVEKSAQCFPGISTCEAECASAFTIAELASDSDYEYRCRRKMLELIREMLPMDYYELSLGAIQKAIDLKMHYVQISNHAECVDSSVST